MTYLPIARALSNKTDYQAVMEGSVLQPLFKQLNHFGATPDSLAKMVIPLHCFGIVFKMSGGQHAAATLQGVCITLGQPRTLAHITAVFPQSLFQVPPQH